MSETRVCVVGAGNLSSRRIYPYLGTTGAVLAGVCDLDREKAEEKTRLYGGAAFAEMGEMLDQTKPDGVVICIGPEQHAALSKEAIRRGIPVYTEKPPAPSAAAALEIASLSRQSGVPVVTGFKKRYATAYSRAKVWLDERDPSEQLSISIDYASATYANDSPRTSFLLDFGIHAIDLIGFLFGDVKRVFAFHRDEHAYAVSLLFASGAVGSLNLNDGRSFTIPTEEVEISLRNGTFMSIRNSSSWRITEGGKATEWREPATFVSGGDSGEDTGHLTELVSFVRSLKAPASLRSNIYESYKSMVLYEAISCSATSGTIVDVEYKHA